ncbi:glutamine--fructose-6-phosphate transaminase (isomerizing) [Citroniella saccharovorans]|uniref:Glutamine--fructose-6-phosphate aminotransferase [isomerizing] n=1 Tax=Citroniella saccharovorans TaxID=2053367 RepID=A0AAW9MSN2_9FIRM|nr:glutamine--fructose-6-phosphate transaminase (isomerizing) [Citroniella saccharovorans]MEB3430189.1 glutamine--fructose-6-phosphate transaminase (isomerizing) [Citroniella saccharovorans]
MCGITGYIGKNNGVEKVLEGLSKLEYRGYDSAGLAAIDNGKLNIVKTKGRLKELEKLVLEGKVEGNVVIGHTRWATHGVPSGANSHPHTSMDGKIAVVHNGIIENFRKIKDSLLEKGYVFKSETDSEVIGHLISYYYDENKDPLLAIKKAFDSLEGSYACLIIFLDHADKIFAVKKDSPLVIGVGGEEVYLASDPAAFIKYTKNIIYLENNEIATLGSDEIKIFNMDLEKVDCKVEKSNLNEDSASKEGFETFTLKEIYEQPKVCMDTLNSKLENGDIVYEDFPFTKEELSKINKIYTIGCGTAFYAGINFSYLAKKMLGIESFEILSSEFRYDLPNLDENSLIVAVSQSGETADTLAALKEARKMGAKIVAITNVLASAITRLSDYSIYTLAGPEIGVCSTKAYTSQLMAIYEFILYLAKATGKIDESKFKEYIEELKSIPEKQKKILDDVGIYEEIANVIKEKSSAFYIGRLIDYKTAMEGALKLKEISYIHTEAFPAGELKHGSIALIEEKTPVIAVLTQEEVFEKTLSNLEEVKARGAVTIGIYSEIFRGKDKTDFSIFVPETYKVFYPILTAISVQLIAYNTAKALNRDVDKPRNLAKSVTVE